MRTPGLLIYPMLLVVASCGGDEKVLVSDKDETAVLDPGTTVGEPAQGNVITVENFQTILEQVIDRLYFGFYQPAFNGMQFTNDVTLDSESSVGITTNRSFSCSGGGTYQIVEEVGGAASSFTQSLSDCQADGVLYNGVFDSNSVFGHSSVESWTGYSAVSSIADQITITYEFDRLFATVVSGDTLKVSNYELITNASREKIQNLVSSVTVNANQVPITAWFEITILDGVVDNQTLRISTLDSFTDLVFTEISQLPVFTKGRLEVVTEDQSRIVINADNGDPETFIASIETQGSVSSIIVNWNERNILPCKGVTFINAIACEH